ncbi:MAG: hypothetical protein GWO02_00125, partial [Gammaproteobacteria bacterium]|nr:hypothetical protein [Gammaproteobacteria bacterium]
MLRRLPCLALSLLLPVWALAQDVPLPQKRAIYEADVDFYGGDLRSIFDTTLELCRAACEAEGSCRAFTYNTRAAACFLKTGVERRDPYIGALSAMMVPLDDPARAIAAARAAELDFLRADDLAGAEEQAREVALDYPGTGDAQARMAAAQAAAR